MVTTAQHATTIPEITSSFTTPVPSPPPFFNPLQQEATPIPTPTTSETTTSLPTWKKMLSDFANPMIEKNVTESVEAAVLTRSSSQPTSTYEAVICTDIAKISRKRLKPDKHGHGNGTERARAWSMLSKVNKSQPMVNSGQP
ncbi:hypothetical protein Tco_1250325 [Tanacetum coccineum]